MWILMFMWVRDLTLKKYNSILCHLILLFQEHLKFGNLKEDFEEI